MSKAPLPEAFDHRVCRIPFDGPGEALPAKDIVGSKAHNLMRMARQGLPVPPGFVLSTAVCRDYLEHGPASLASLDAVVGRELGRLGSLTGRYFGDARRPLLVSVRSGAAVSMPGMMETVLNIGLCVTTLRGFLRTTGNPRLVQDCRVRLVQQYGEVVHDIAPNRFQEALAAQLSGSVSGEIGDLSSRGLRQLAEMFEDIFEVDTGKSFPQDPATQLRAAIEAVLQSWSSERAQSYRRLNDIPENLGTAITIQAMAFGNLGPTSGAGVGFTRNPSSGNNELYVDYLPNAQGEDVVAGRRAALGIDELERRTPDAYRELLAARNLLEREFHDMMDFEFTVEEGHLLMLQARPGKRTPLAALRIARDLVHDEIASPPEALAMLERIDLDKIEEFELRADTSLSPIAQGTPAGIGIAVGTVVFEPDRAAHIKRNGGEVILFRQTAETKDISALAEASALVTAEGARTSHAAVVARQLGKPCIVGCAGLTIDASGRHGKLGAHTLNEGDVISIDGTSGNIYQGRIEVISARPVALLDEVQSWRAAASAPAATKRKRNGAIVGGPERRRS